MKVFSRGFCRLCGVQVDSASKDVLSVPCHDACADELDRQLGAVQQDMAARASLEKETSRQLHRLEKRIAALEGSATTHDEPKRASGRSNYHPIMDASRERQRRFLQEVHDVCMKRLDCEVEGWSARDLASLLLTRMTDTANPPGTAEERRQAAARMGLSEAVEDGAPSENVEALAEAAYTAQVQSIFQEWPCRGQPYVPWSGLEESVKRIHRAAVRAVLERL